MSTRRLPIVATLGLVLLAGTACGETQLGAAALVGGERIPISEIQDSVAKTKAFLEAQSVLASGEGPTAGDEVERRVIELIFQRTATEVGVTATDTEVAALVEEQRTGIGGQTRFLQALAVNGIGPERVDAVFRTEVLSRKISEKLSAGQKLSQGELQRRLQQKLIAVAATLDIKINPRYGSFDATNGVIERKAPSFIIEAPKS